MAHSTSTYIYLDDVDSLYEFEVHLAVNFITLVKMWCVYLQIEKILMRFYCLYFAFVTSWFSISDLLTVIWLILSVFIIILKYF